MSVTSALDRIKARWEAATPGPWEIVEDLGSSTYDVLDGDSPQSVLSLGVVQTNAEAIAAAPEDVRLLLAVARAVEDLPLWKLDDDEDADAVSAVRSALRDLERAP